MVLRFEILEQLGFVYGRRFGVDVILKIKTKLKFHLRKGMIF
ncbi:hypothetical protein SAMN04488692_12014 [Halarsenatibacter silvermanii]|uniref:Uncharacterized protein n=1 Tax=Halarsenatibacter silvermanii TaxID=321763 RepID=A0A1G9R5B8_9FIRM|nr:hypothetical protein SAMN04488692_12014 [Halarsenatibacter silvermanii]